MGRRRSNPLPAESVQAMQDIMNGPGDYRARYLRMAGYRDLLLELGWPLVVIAEARGISRQAVSQWGSGQTDDTDLPPAPVPPPVPVPVKPEKPQPLAVTVEDAKRMRELVPLASQVNGRTSDSSPLKAAGRELAELMAENVKRGVPLHMIGKAAGQSRNAVGLRLVRYGYPELVPPWFSTYQEGVS